MKKNYGLILTPAAPDEWVLGSGVATERFGSAKFSPDWTPHKTTDEDQRRFGFETSNCTNFHSIRPWIMTAKAQGFDDFVPNASERYTGFHTGTVAGRGNNPNNVCEVIRKECGLIPEESMPWTEDIDTPEEYYDRSQAMANLPFGKKFLERFELGHEWVFPPFSWYTPKEKAELIKKALERGAVAVSVRAWRKDGKFYTKKPGEKDNHWVTAIRYDGKNLVVHDSYSPYEKKLIKDYDFNSAKVYFVKRIEDRNPNIWSIIWDNFKKLWS